MLHHNIVNPDIDLFANAIVIIPIPIHVKINAAQMVILGVCWNKLLQYVKRVGVLLHLLTCHADTLSNMVSCFLMSRQQTHIVCHTQNNPNTKRVVLSCF